MHVQHRRTLRSIHSALAHQRSKSALLKSPAPIASPFPPPFAPAASTTHDAPRAPTRRTRSSPWREATRAPAPPGSLAHARCLPPLSPGARALGLPRFRDAARLIARLPAPTPWAARPSYPAMTLRCWRAVGGRGARTGMGVEKWGAPGCGSPSGA